MDDDFSSIVVGIKEGRTIFDNLTKSIAYVLTHMVPEVVPILLSLALGFPPALSPILILIIDLGTEMCPAISLAYEPAEADVMTRPPRNSHTDRLVTGKVIFYSICQSGVIICLTGFIGFFLTFEYFGVPASSLYNTSNKHWGSGDDMRDWVGNTDDEKGFLTPSEQLDLLYKAQTCYFALLVLSQMFNVLCCKTRTVSVFSHGLLNNTNLCFGLIISFFILIFVVFFPFSHSFFGSDSFPGRYWGLLCLSGGILVIWSETRKWFARNRRKGLIDRWFSW
jgi:sodium/potassium-transporting ATPase subunit alpha